MSDYRLPLLPEIVVHYMLSDSRERLLVVPVVCSRICDELELLRTCGRLHVTR